MNIASQFDRLDKLIVDRSAEISTMRGILHSIREQVEAYQKESESHAALKSENQKLIATIAKLQAANQKPSIEVIDQAPQPPSETFL